MRTLYWIIIVFVIVAISAALYDWYTHAPFETEEDLQASERDEHGCRIAAGFSFSESVGACIRSFEFTEDLRRAAALAVDAAGEEHGLTVISFNAIEESGSFDILLGRNEGLEREVIYIRNWEVVEPISVQLYYYSEARDRDETGNIRCSEKGLVPVARTLAPNEPMPIEATIRLLLSGDLTNAERNTGISTEYPLPGFVLKESSLESGVLSLIFSDPEGSSVGGACRVSILRAQIVATALQFPEVKEVRFMPEDLFQP